MLKLGQKVKDIITGYEGIITGRVEYLTGCNQCLVVAKVKEDNTLKDGAWFDEQRLQLLDPLPLALPAAPNHPGSDAAPSRRY